MIFEHALLRIAPDDQSLFDERAPQARAILLRTPGCHEVQIHKSVDEPDLYLLLVKWDRIESHLENFPSTPEAAELDALIGDLFNADPVVVHFCDHNLAA